MPSHAPCRAQQRRRWASRIGRIVIGEAEGMEGVVAGGQQTNRRGARNQRDHRKGPSRSGDAQDADNLPGGSGEAGGKAGHSQRADLATERMTYTKV